MKHSLRSAAEDPSPLSQLSPLQCLEIAYQMLKLPALLAYKLPPAILHPTSPFHAQKKWTRLVYDITVRHVTRVLSPAQLRLLQRGTRSRYIKWCKKNRMPVTIEESGEGGRLLWVGEKSVDRVVLFFHGGGFVCPLDKTALHFMRRVQTRLAEAGCPVGLAILEYFNSSASANTLAPSALAPAHPFPTQLLQANAALAHLFAAGLRAENLQLVGDSAGANLVLQVLGWAMHPVVSAFPHSDSDPDGTPAPTPHPNSDRRIPKSPLAAGHPLAGALFASPWLNLAASGGSFAANDEKDIVCARTFGRWGRMLLDAVGEEEGTGVEWRGYLDAGLVIPPSPPSPSPASSSASPASPRERPPEEDEHKQEEAGEDQEAWFAPLPALVSRILLTAGEHECFRADIGRLYDALLPRSSASCPVPSYSASSKPTPNFHPQDPKLESHADADSHPKPNPTGKLELDLEMHIEPYASHDEHFYGFDGDEGRVGDGTRVLVGWLARGFGVEVGV